MPSSPPSIWLTVSGRAEDSALIAHRYTSGTLSITSTTSSTYRASDGRFCLIDFELATILERPASAAA
jgi:hypothetical protein